MTKFDATKTKDELVKWIRDWFLENGPDCKAVIGISGGKDSTIVAALCVEALGADRVFGVLMPNGEQSDIDVSYKVVNYLKIPHICVNIDKAYYGVLSSINNALNLANYNDIKITDLTQTNLPPRLRMSTLYAVSQSVNGRVSNNSNLSEYFLGYYSKNADNLGDFSPLLNLTVTEVKQIGYALGLPEEFIEKKPADGLLSGKTDEDNFGFTYEVLDKYITEGYCENENVKKLIDERHAKNLFKQKPLPSFHPNRS